MNMILFFSIKKSAGLPALEKSSGWWGPGHGGTHVVHAPVKDIGDGGGGVGGFAASKPDVSTYDKAKAYWLKHFGGKTLNLVVHSGSENIPIKVLFHETNDHAYTRGKYKDKRSLERIFDLKRAEAMPRILDVIQRPSALVKHHNSDLLVEKHKNGERYTIVLTWDKKEKVYTFNSAHFKSINEVQDIIMSKKFQKNNGPLQSKRSPNKG